MQSPFGDSPIDKHAAIWRRDLRSGDSGEVNLKTGISMPQFFARDGRFFVAYNINKEHLLLDEIPADILDEMTPPQSKTLSPAVLR